LLGQIHQFTPEFCCARPEYHSAVDSQTTLIELVLDILGIVELARSQEVVIIDTATINWAVCG
jgi:hypothetical protein